jgi:hypothetical protein
VLTTNVVEIGIDAVRSEVMQIPGQVARILVIDDMFDAEAAKELVLSRWSHS